MENQAFDALTKGALQQITDGEDVEEPVFQCVQVKPMANQGDVERYRVVVSDSANFIQCMLSGPLNALVHESKLLKGCMVRLKQFTCNFVKDKHILVLTDLDILEEYGILEKLGQPGAIVAKAEGQEQKPQPGNIASNGFYGNKPQGQEQPQQQSRALVSRSGGGAHGSIYPIEALSPYAHKWTIKARCTFKSDIKTWHNKNGEGKLFSVNFLDDSGEIRATGFNDAVDQWYEVLQKNSVYYVSSPCKVQLAKKQFSNVNNDYELTFEKDTLIEKAEDNDGVPQVTFNFTSIANLETVEKDNIIDVIGVLQNIDEVSEIVSKTSGKPYSKRELTLVDDSGYQIRLTVWGKTAESFDAPLESVVAFKGVKVNDFNGRSLSLLSSGSMTVDPEVEQAYNLKGWYDGAGRNEQFQSHANTMSTVNAMSGGDRNATKTIAQIRDENLGMGEETDWFSLKATIVYIKQDGMLAYPACRSENCNKKVSNGDGNDLEWRCEKCNVTWDLPDYRYIMQINVADHTGQLWLSCFNESGELIMGGMKANELMAIKEEDDRRYAETIQAASCHTFTFRCKAKQDNYGEQQRVRYQVQYAKPLDFAAEAKKLAETIKQYSLQENSLFVT